MTAPPRTAEAILESLGASAQFREPLLGDLAEEFAVRAPRDGVASASAWYYRETMRAAPHLLWDGLRSLDAGEIRRITSVVAASFCFANLLALLLLMMAFGVMAEFGIPHLRFATAGGPLRLIAISLALLTYLLGGVIAAWLDRRAPLASALALGVTWSGIVLSGLQSAPGVDPGWMRLLLPIAIVASTAIGGVLHVRSSRSPTGNEPFVAQ